MGGARRGTFSAWRCHREGESRRHKNRRISPTVPCLVYADHFLESMTKPAPQGGPFVSGKTEVVQGSEEEFELSEPKMTKQALHLAKPGSAGRGFSEEFRL